MSAAHDVTGTWDDVFAGAAANVREAAEAARAAILAAHPGAVELARPGERSVCFGFGPKKNSEAYVYLMPHSAHANIGFFRGAALPDPDGLLEGTGRDMRHVKLKTADAALRPQIAALVAAARAERAAALGKEG